MDIAQKALYNSLRISWLQNAQISIEPWKVEDYRQLSLDELFSRLQIKELFLDRSTFKGYTDQFDSPEELTEWLVDDEQCLPEDYDQMYLVIFELWRRLVPEKPSISIICDELDHQIFLYDQGERKEIEPLQDALNSLHSIMEENVDRGMEAREVFSAISEFCANDIEEFLYDYILDQVAANQYDYANELVEQFSPFAVDAKWFDLLKARLANVEDLHAANDMLRSIFEMNQEEPSLEFFLALLTLMVQGGNYDLFLEVVDETLKLIEAEEDFIELLTISSDFFRCLDQEDIQARIDAMIEKRASKVAQDVISRDDPDVRAFRELLTG